MADEQDDPAQNGLPDDREADSKGDSENDSKSDRKVDLPGAEDEQPIESVEPVEPIVQVEQVELEAGLQVDEIAALQDDGEDAGHAGLEGQAGHVGQVGDEAGSGTSGPLRASAELKAILEALIFASPDPLTRKAIGKLLTTEPAEDIDASLDELKRDYERPGGLQLVEVAGGYQIVTRSDLHEWVRRLFHERTTQKLTVQALETLAVIAYRQPVTALEVTEIRGVTAAGVLNTLLERHLIKIVGRKKVVGRPFLYATTKEFLIRFGLNEISDLPKVEDMAEALGFEPPLLIEHVPSEETLPLEEPEPESGAGEPSEDEPTKIQ